MLPTAGQDGQTSDAVGRALTGEKRPSFRTLARLIGPMTSRMVSFLLRSLRHLERHNVDFVLVSITLCYQVAHQGTRRSSCRI